MLPPVVSPLSAGALWSGLSTGLKGGGSGTSELEALLRQTFDADEVVLTDSGTTALALGMGTAGAAPVALPAYGCYDLATAADTAGVPVLLYDVMPATLQPEWSSLERALAAGAGTAVAVHLFGMPVDMDRFTALASASGATVVEDSAQGIGGTWRGGACGSLGAISVLSFGRGKGLTGGGGGAVLGRGGAAVAAPTLRQQSGARNWVATLMQWILTRPSLYGLPASLPMLRLGETIYHPPRAPGAITSAAIGTLLGTWQPSHGAVAGRRQVARQLVEALQAIPGVEPIGPVAGATPGYLRLPVLAAQLAANGDRLASLRRWGVYRGYPRPLGSLPGFDRRVRNPERACPGADELARTLVTLPTHRFVGASDIASLAANLGA